MIIILVSWPTMCVLIYIIELLLRTRRVKYYGYNCSTAPSVLIIYRGVPVKKIESDF